MTNLLKWNLNELFTSKEECYQAFKTIEEMIKNLQRWKKIDLTEEWRPTYRDIY